jgi:hypothetical protein
VDAEESYVTLNISSLDKLFGEDRSSTLTVHEGLELIRAFAKIEREEDRLRIIELAKRLSSASRNDCRSDRGYRKYQNM